MRSRDAEANVGALGSPASPPGRAGDSDDPLSAGSQRGAEASFRPYQGPLLRPYDP